MKRNAGSKSRGQRPHRQGGAKPHAHRPHGPKSHTHGPHSHGGHRPKPAGGPHPRNPHRRGPARRPERGPTACPMCGEVVSNLAWHIRSRHDDAASHPRD